MMVKEEFKEIVYAIRIAMVELMLLSQSPNLEEVRDEIYGVSDRIYELTSVLDTKFSLRLPDTQDIIRMGQEIVELKRMYNLK